ncbi:glycosyltransferase family 90 protein [Xylariomycetidae sp. FL2044]|nr:glycosyltransferase family 90 protein [Xylariomycetidae sp. FL2044]
MMRSPAFPPRRPSHLVRYIVPALLLICLFYYLSSDPADVAIPSTHIPNDHAISSSNSDTIKQQPVKGPSVVDRPGSLTHQDNEYGHKEGSAPAVQDSKTGSKPNSKPGSKQDSNSKSNSKPGSNSKPDSKPNAKPDPVGSHPIDHLIHTANKDFEGLLAKKATSLVEAAEAYRKRRGRHPPPGFEQWFNFAKENKAVIVEDFFDQIYHDLNPFWGLEPKMLRREAAQFEMTINVRNGNASAESDWFWTQIWLTMIKTIEHMLPDMDIALNAMDEPRIVAPWEDIDFFMEKERQSRKITPLRDLATTFQELPAPKKLEKTPATTDKKWEDTSPYWVVARRGCPPDSPARKSPLLETYDTTPSFSPSWATPHQYQGYVSNSSLSSEFCHQPDLQGLEGIFIQPLTTSATKTLFPLFGGSKLATNNEILLPAPMYWNEEERFTGGEDHGPAWENKIGDLIWRGVATGGRNNESNWKGFQRHRFVAMNNATTLALAQDEVKAPVNFELPASTYNVAAQKEKRLGPWVSQWSDVGFTDLFCDPDYEPQEEEGMCAYTDEHYEVLLGQKMAVQFNWKYLPDIDGNSFSGRYLGFLRSTSLPIKSTLWREWHDSRLVAWKHFVPMDNRFGDYYGIMEYFMGYENAVPGHDEAARRIAMDGKEWAEKVLRKEDMQIYIFRLLLEYARLCDDRREKMGWADDLLT